MAIINQTHIRHLISVVYADSHSLPLYYHHTYEEYRAVGIRNIEIQAQKSHLIITVTINI